MSPFSEAADVALAVNMFISLGKQQKAFPFPKLSTHIYSDSCTDVSQLIGENVDPLTTNKCNYLTVWFVLEGDLGAGCNTD